MTAVTPSPGTDRPRDAASASPTPTQAPPRRGDLVITLVLLVVFAGGYLAARGWPLEAALFPQLLSAAGVILAVLKLIGIGLQQARARRAVAAARGDSAPPAPPAGSSAPDPALSADSGGPDPAPPASALESERLEGEDDDKSIEYVFGSASGREWAAALAWGLGFFVLLWVAGVFITVPLFCFAYLRFAGRASWLAAAGYAAVAGGVIWLVFHKLLLVPMPAGIF